MDLSATFYTEAHVTVCLFVYLGPNTYNMNLDVSNKPETGKDLKMQLHINRREETEGN